MDGGAQWATVHVVAKVGEDLATKQQQLSVYTKVYICNHRDITLPTKIRLVKAVVFLWSCMDVRVGL